MKYVPHPRFPSDGWLRTLLSRFISKNGIPGAGVALLVRGRPIEAYCGFADLESKAPITANSRFELACLTKLITAVLCLRLAEKGLLNLSDQISSHIPELVRSRGDKAAPICIGHLLSHSSGYLGVDVSKAEAIWHYSWQKFADYFESTPQLFDPGTVFSYEHSGHVILGKIIERITGVSSSALIEETLSQGLRISIGRRQDDNKHPHLRVVGYSQFPGKNELNPVGISPYCDFWRSSLSGSTIGLADLAHLGSSILGSQTHGLNFHPSRDLLSTLCKPVIVLPKAVRPGVFTESFPLAFSAGCAIYSDGSIGHNGSLNGHMAGLRVDPINNVIIAVGLNRWLPHVRDAIIARILDYISFGDEDRSASLHQSGNVPFKDIFGGFSISEILGRYSGSFLGTAEVDLQDDCVTCNLGSGHSRTRAFTIHKVSADTVSIKAYLPTTFCFCADPVSGTPYLMLGIHAYKRMTHD